MSLDHKFDSIYQLILTTLKYSIMTGKLNSLPPQLQMKSFITNS